MDCNLLFLCHIFWNWNTQAACTQLGPVHEINFREAPNELQVAGPTDVVIEGSEECVRKHNLVRVSLLTFIKFEVDEDSGQIKFMQCPAEAYVADVIKSWETLQKLNTLPYVQMNCYLVSRIGSTQASCDMEDTAMLVRFLEHKNVRLRRVCAFAPSRQGLAAHLKSRHVRTLCLNSAVF